MKITPLFAFAALVPVLSGCSAVDRKPAVAPTVKPVILRTIPHDSAAFTQGLVYKGGKLYESTGAPSGTGSSIRTVDPVSGAVLSSTPIPGVFAEGLALAGSILVQLTWRDHVAFVYSFPGCGRQGAFQYEGEGWGLAWDGSAYVMSTGSDTLYYRDTRFTVIRRVPVRYNGQPLKNLNELEYVKGTVYANVWYSNFIFAIDPRSGAVTKVVDCSELVQKSGTADENAVLNGIAYDEESGTFYLTGKDWKFMFEVRIP